MRVEARRLADEKKDTVGKAISEAFVDRERARFSTIECVAISVRMRALGRAGLTVVVAGGGGANTGTRK